MIIISTKKDLEEIRKVLKVLGIEDQAELGWISDETETEEGINFKINYLGNSVPVWIKGIFKKEDLNNMLSAISAGLSAGMNIVEISEKLKSGPTGI